MNTKLNVYFSHLCIHIAMGNLSYLHFLSKKMYVEIAPIWLRNAIFVTYIFNFKLFHKFLY